MRTAIKAISAAAMLTALAVSAAPASAATTLNAGWTEGCGKTNCFNDQGSFTKSWSSGDVSGPITIGQLLLDRGILGDLDSKTFRLSFRLNGQELGTWGNYTMGGIAGDELSFQGVNFTWNPEDGDLELVLELIPPPKAGAGGAARFASIPDEDGSTPNSGGPKSEGGDGSQQEGRDPVPGQQVGGVPEPSTWALMIGGFGMAGATFRRKRAVLAAQPSR
ncbi:MAG: PEPxxWA-CTERM sorting domain-containing protein [Pseudomonadota bacterium]